MLFANYQKMATQAPSTSGIIHKDGFSSYARMAEQAEHLAAGFLSVGMGLGDNVAVLMDNSPLFHVTCLALFAIGATAVPVNIKSRKTELMLTGSTCSISAVVVRPDLVGFAQEILGAAQNPNGPILQPWGQPGRDIESLLKTPFAALPTIQPNTVAVTLFSSGSTGRPKPVPQTHANMIRSGRRTAGGLKMTSEDIIFNALPAHHSFGFMSASFEATARGTSTYIWADPSPLLLARQRMLETLQVEKITILPGVPFVYQTLAQSTGSFDLSAIRLAYSAGISLKREIYDAFHARFGIQLAQGYGCTEVGLMASNAFPDPAKAWDSVGHAIGDIKISARDEYGVDRDRGELFIEANSVTAGYLGANEAANAVFRDGGYYSGDLGRIGEDGEIYITGRAKLVVEIAGEKIDPTEIEDLLCDHIAVAEAVVVGVPSAQNGTRLKAVIVRAEQGVQDHTLIAHCRQNLSPFKVPELIEFVDAIPKSATGKILRGQLMDG